MDKSHSLSYLMIVHSLEVKNKLLCPKEDNEELLGLEVPYYNVIGVPMNLANYTQPNIAFLVNLLVKLLVKYSSTPPQRHWNKINHVIQ